MELKNICTICGIEYIRKKTEGKDKFLKRKFCSRKCAYVGRKFLPPPNLGKKASEETKRKQSESHKGNPGYWKGKKLPLHVVEDMSRRAKGKPSPMKGRKYDKPAWNKGLKMPPSWIKGKHQTEETKQKCREANKGKNYSPSTQFEKGLTPWNKGKPSKQSGENHYNWKGGRTKERSQIMIRLDYRTWRKIVFHRDNYTCQMCGDKGVKIHAHHIKKFSERPDLRFETSNGITLCQRCHVWTHKREHLFEQQFTNMVKKQLAA